MTTERREVLAVVEGEFDADEYEDDGAGGDGDLPFDLAQFGSLADEIDEWAFDHCPIKRGDRVLYPFQGQSFWLLPYGTAELDNALLQFAGGAQDERPGDMAGSFDSLREGLSRVVAGWTLEDPVDGPYPQPWRNPDVWRLVPSEVLYYVIQLYRSGEYPEARPNGSGRQLGTSGIRRSSGQRTRPSNTGRRRR